MSEYDTSSTHNMIRKLSKVVVSLNSTRLTYMDSVDMNDVQLHGDQKTLAKEEKEDEESDCNWVCAIERLLTQDHY